MKYISSFSSNITSVVLLSAAALALCGCGKFSLYDPDRGEKLASVGSQTLYENDVRHIFSPGMTPEDSTAQLELFVNQWIRNQVKSQAAEQSLQEYQEKIEQMVAEYRNSLITHQFEEGFVDANIDTNITTEHINEYYNSHAGEFRLAGPLVKARIARIPAGLRQSEKLQKMFSSNVEQDWLDFVNICNKNNYKIVDFSTQWAEFNQLLQQIPFSNTNFDEFLKTKKYYEVEDDQYKYMMVITDKMLTGEKSPLEREVQNIRRILLNNRRSELIVKLEDSLMNISMSGGKIEIEPPLKLVTEKEIKDIIPSNK